MNKESSNQAAQHKVLAEDCSQRAEAYYKQLEEIKKQMEASAHFDESDLMVRLDYVDILNEKFMTTISTIQNGEIESQFMMLYLDVKAMIKRKISAATCGQPNLSSTVHPYIFDNSITMRRTRLPELKIPKFSGSYTDWPDFIATFNSVIDNDMELSKIEKLQHLRVSLNGAALDTISSLEPSEDNYDKAIELLKNRFDNKLLIFQTHIKNIFGLEGADKGGATSLRQLSDKMNAHMRALSTICSMEQVANGLIVYVVASKLDGRTKARWEEELKDDQLPTWKAMASFLERRCRTIENLEGSYSNKICNQMSKKPNYKSAHVCATAKCLYCDAKDHFITNCPRFGNLTVEMRSSEVKRLGLCINCLKKGHYLQKCMSRSCRHCSLRHHSLLHIFSTNTQEPKSAASSSSGPSSASSGPTETSTSGPTLSAPSASSLSTYLSTNAQESFSGNNVLLATAIIMVKNKYGTFMPCRAILDSASQLNFITARAANMLKLNVEKAYVTIGGIGDGSFVADKHAFIHAKSCHSDYSTSFQAVVVPTITEYQPDVNIDLNSWTIPKNINLADPNFSKRGRIDILIGAGTFFDLLAEGTIRIGDNSHILKKTVLGWVVSGGGVCSSNTVSLTTAVKYVTDSTEESLNNIVKSFWEIENNFNSTNGMSKEDIFCEQHFQKNTTRLESGEYSVYLPKNDQHNQLGDSYDRALQRFFNLEKKLSKNPNTKMQYSAFMKEYADLRHMSEFTSIPTGIKPYYLPHHCVHKEDSTTTKLRVVFDGSAKTSTGVSLNDTLYAGPTIQPKLFTSLLRFRLFKIALSGDICKMYRCVKVSSPDNFLQCILWRDDPTENIKMYALDTVTYGTKPAAFLAIRAMHQLCEDEGYKYPVGAAVVKENFYVDDMISGGNSIEEVINIRHQVTDLLKLGHFNIRKWCSNHPAVLKGIPKADCEKFLKFSDGTDITKTLGLIWDPKTDMFIFEFSHVSMPKQITKRTILSTIARFYDPLGLIGPVITKAKVFIQTLWKNKLNWDESIPTTLSLQWKEYISTFSMVNKLIFPRFVSISDSKVQVHSFCDASLVGYGACIYIRSQKDDQIKVELLCSKSRVAPLKVLTVPKLELQAANLLATLLEDVSKQFNGCTFYCWSDSMVVLSWLRHNASSYNVFVANRVSRIQHITENMIWQHIPTNMNPADILSRGASPEELLKSTLWSHGPEFLQHGEECWPKNDNFLSELPEKRKTALSVTYLNDISLKCKFLNSFHKLQRTFGYIYRFINIRKFKNFKSPLTLEEIEMGTHILLRNIQATNLSEEYKLLKDEKSVTSSSKLFSLNPVMDSFGLIRVGGRLQFSTLPYEAQHPIILPKNHPITTTIVTYYHEKLLHAGPQALLAHIRQKYWPIGGRKTVGRITAKCVRCFILKPKYAEHIMGNLPKERVTPSRAFYTTGIDFCGPFFYKSEVKTRGPIKCYICIYICFTTKAVHMELVKDLSTASFLASLKRFISIRGKPKAIWSDNATNFTGAKNQLGELHQLFFDQAKFKNIHDLCLNEEIEWKFIPPRSPHFGGIWEAAVKAAKYHFIRAVGSNILAYDELHTLVCQISAILNSRPICSISENPEDLDVLTPAHFLVGSPMTTFAEPNVIDLDLKRLDRWQMVSNLQQTFWHKWSASYLSTLQERTKWKKSYDNIKIGSLALLKDENLPPLKWLKGRVIELITGSDGVARVAVLKISNGTTRRAISKLAILPIDPDVESHDLSTGGGCSDS